METSKAVQIPTKVGGINGEKIEYDWVMENLIVY